MCVFVSKQVNIFRKGKKKNHTQPLHKHAHLFYHDKPGEYHERFYEEKSTLSMSISARLYKI